MQIYFFQNLYQLLKLLFFYKKDNEFLFQLD
nr:MAG TPA: hypothetical protein [Caudoviricetes sp.]